MSNVVDISSRFGKKKEPAKITPVDPVTVSKSVNGEDLAKEEAAALESMQLELLGAAHAASAYIEAMRDLDPGGQIHLVANSEATTHHSVEWVAGVNGAPNHLAPVGEPTRYAVTGVPVDAWKAHAHDPEKHYVVLKIGFNAVRQFGDTLAQFSPKTGEDLELAFSCRFNRISHDLVIPASCIAGMYYLRPGGKRTVIHGGPVSNYISQRALLEKLRYEISEKHKGDS